MWKRLPPLTTQKEINKILLAFFDFPDLNQAWVFLNLAMGQDRCEKEGRGGEGKELGRKAHLRVGLHNYRGLSFEDEKAPANLN